jgi:hypothetical protein
MSADTAAAGQVASNAESAQDVENMLAELKSNT